MFMDETYEDAVLGFDGIGGGGDRMSKREENRGCRRNKWKIEWGEEGAAEEIIGLYDKEQRWGRIG